MQCRVIIYTYPFMRKSMIKFINSYNPDIVVKIAGKDKLELITDGETCIYILTELRYKYPKAFISGSSEPVE